MAAFLFSTLLLNFRVLKPGRAAEIFLIFRRPSAMLADICRVFNQLFNLFKVVLQLTDMLVMAFTAIPHFKILPRSYYVQYNILVQIIK